MRMVNRMIELTSGDILLDGGSVRERQPADLRRDIGYVIQQIGLFPHQSDRREHRHRPAPQGWDRARIRQRVDELLELIGLDADMRDRYPAQLSGGQRQRVGVARALAADPPLMLMDEPFGAIDPINRDRLQNEFLRLQREIRKTIVFVTHDIDEAIKMGDRIAMLKKGGILAQYGPPDELLLQPADAFVEDFVGADRALKRLALHRVADADLDPLPEDGPPDLPRVPRTASLRDALSAMIAEGGGDRAVVTGDDGRPVGVLTIETIRARTRAEERALGEART